MPKDYYQILGVEKNASPEDIRKAYHRLAHLYHPDKGGDENKFKEVNEAYQTLSNKDKRAQYDQFGRVFEGGSAPGGQAGGWNFDFGQSAQGGSGWDASDLNDLFGGRFGFGDIMGDIFENMRSQVQAEVEISLTQAMLGGEVQLKTFDNDTVTLDIPPGMRDGTSFRFRGKGRSTRRGRRGDLTIIARIRLPDHLTREQRELFEKLRQTGL